MPDILQHCFSAPGLGGPATALSRLQEQSQPPYPVIWQTEPAGGLSLPLLRRFVREIRHHKPRVIHVRGLGNEGFHAALAARIAGVPEILVSVHGSHRDLKRPASAWRHAVVTRILEPLTLSMATGITTVCSFAARRDFIQKHAAKLLPPVPNGVPLPALDKPARAQVRAELGIGPERCVVACVSRLTLEKGYSDLAEALRQIDTPSSALDVIIVGGGDEDGSIRALFSPLAHIRVHFVGFQRDVGRYLEAADIFAMPSWSENLSNALLEGMSYGLPAITTAVGGSTEVVEQGGGILVPPQDPGPLAEALAALAADPGRREELGRAARANIEANYSLAGMVAKWEQLYGLLLDRAR